MSLQLLLSQLCWMNFLSFGTSQLDWVISEGIIIPFFQKLFCLHSAVSWECCRSPIAWSPDCWADPRISFIWLYEVLKSKEISLVTLLYNASLLQTAVLRVSVDSQGMLKWKSPCFWQREDFLVQGRQGLDTCSNATTLVVSYKVHQSCSRL